MTENESIPLILSVDISPDWHWIIGDVLKKNRIKLIRASDVDGARALLLEQHFDLVISGVKLPDGSGMDVLQIVETLGIPFIFCTSFTRDLLPPLQYEKLGYVWKGEVRNLASEVTRLLKEAS